MAKEIFDFDRYLSFFDEQTKPFMKEFCKTQGFQNFIERSLDNTEKNDILSFKEGVELCAEKGKNAITLQMKKINDRLLYYNKNVI